jgi:murein DD-endopeptidase MepM/ murein hydrolase activator NlpD
VIYLKQKSKLLVFLLIVSLVLLYFRGPWALGDATTDTLKTQKNEVQQKLNEVNNKIKSYQSQIAQVQKQANTLKNQVSLIDLQISSTSAQIDATNTKIDAANLEIADVTEQIVKTEQDIQKQKDILRELISQINDLDQRTPLEIALENENFAEFLNELQYTSTIQERSQEAMNQIKKLKADLEERQKELKKQKAELDALSSQLNEQKASLDKQRVAKQSLLDQTRGTEKNYQKLLAASKSESDALNKEIFDLDEQINKKLGNNRLPKIKGLLAWAMDGILTQGYGNTGFTSLGYSFHNGIDLAAPAGTPIYAAAAGTVLDTGTGKGAYGNWVAIKHPVSAKYGNRALVTLYGHMSSFVRKPGESVKAGDLVGFEGNTGNTTALLYGPHRGYHLHFTVFDFEGFGVAPGSLKQFGKYEVPFGATYNPLDFL